PFLGSSKNLGIRFKRRERLESDDAYDHFLDMRKKRTRRSVPLLTTELLWTSAEVVARRFVSRLGIVARHETPNGSGAFDQRQVGNCRYVKWALGTFRRAKGEAVAGRGGEDRPHRSARGLAARERATADVIEFDQVIYEYTWVHLGLSLDPPRRQLLTLRR